MSLQYKKYIEQPTTSLSISQDGTYDVVEKAQVIVTTINEVTEIPQTKSTDIIKNLTDGSYYAWKTVPVYNIVTSLTNVTGDASNPTTVEEGLGATLLFTANQDYVLPETITVTGASYTWTKSTGTLVLSNATGNVGIVIVGESTATELCFTANTAGSTVLPPRAFEYSTDRTTWNTASTSFAITLTNVGDKIYMRRGSLSMWSSTMGTFTITGSVAVSGNIMSLVDNTMQSLTIPTSSCFYRAFKECPITTAPELPATTVTYGCYQDMFAECSTLVTGPSELPASTLENYSYYSMFYNCTSMTTGPAILASTIGQSSCERVFMNCSSLTNLSIPNVTSVGVSAFEYCCYGCTSLVDVNVVLSRVTTLATSCYASFFYNCRLMTKVPALPATTMVERCYYKMFSDCASLYVSETSGSGYSQAWSIPTSGTATGDYEMTNMFYGCQGTRSTNSPNFNGIQKTYYTQNIPM